jgi:PmbA protein
LLGPAGLVEGGVGLAGGGPSWGGAAGHGGDENRRPEVHRRHAAAHARHPHTHPRGAVSAEAGFAYSRDTFRQIVEDVLRLAREAGASDAAAEVSEGSGLSVSVRKGELENVERNRDKSVGVTVFVGQRRGSASTSDFSAAALRQTVRAAFDIARFTAETRPPACPTRRTWSTHARPRVDLDLFHPWEVDAAAAAGAGAALRAGGLRHRPAHHQFRGRGRSRRSSRTSGPATRAAFAAATRVRATRMSVAPIAGRGPAHAARRLVQLHARRRRLLRPEAIGRYAASARCRAWSRARAHRQVPVLFEAPVAAGLLGALRAGRLSGGSLYRRASFLLDSAGPAGVRPTTWTSAKTRTALKGKGSAPFDDEGVRTQRAQVVAAGRVQGYFLAATRRASSACAPPATPAARTTCSMTSRLTAAGDDLDAMLRKLRPRAVRHRADGAGRRTA